METPISTKSATPTLVNVLGTLDSSELKAESRKDVPVDMSKLSTWVKYGLLGIFTLAQFQDACSNSMLFPAIPHMTADLSFTPGQEAWLFAAYQATFASFLLISGRISDIYSPKPVFIAGNLILGIMSLGGGFVQNKIGLLILRAFSGIGAAFTISSALNLIVRLFPDPAEQSRAISWFGSAGAFGNVGGLLIGGVLAEFATWHWIFWLITLIAVPIALVSFIFIPTQPLTPASERPGLDLIGITTLTGTTEGWGTAGVIAPLVISVVLAIAFFYWETRVDQKDAALPPKLWFYPNFSALFSVALLPYFWWISIFLLFPPLWQEAYGYSTIMTAVRFLPIGVGMGAVSAIAGYLPKYFQVKRILLTGIVTVFAGTLLLPFANTEKMYWPLVFPGFSLGTVGAMLMYSSTNIAFFQTTPPEVAGTVGAVFNAALQLGSALGVSALTSVQTSIDAKYPGTNHGYAGRVAAFWFAVALIGVQGIAVLVFYKPDRKVTVDVEAKVVDEDLSEIAEKKVRSE